LQNADLYWALAGGGGGTYGAVLSMTTRLHKNMPTAGVTLSFVEASDTYWEVVKVFLMNLPGVLRAGAVLYWQVIPGNMFIMPQAYLPGGTAKDLEGLLKPTLDVLTKRNIPFSLTSTDFPAFQNAFKTLNPEMNITEFNLGGSLIPRSLVASDKSATGLIGGIKSIVGNGGILAGVSMDVSRQPPVPNSAHPGWRDSLFLAFLGTYVTQSFASTFFTSQECMSHNRYRRG
jgi:hypothetical protein